MLVLTGFFIFTQTSFAQSLSIRFQHLTVVQGLSNNLVHAITQGGHAFIWIGTEDGLNRFDGINTEVFRNKPGDINSLPSNEILCLFTDSRGKVWIGTSNGFACYDEFADSFHSFFRNRSDKNANVVSSINEDAHGTLWIGTRVGLCSLDLKNNHFHRFIQGDRSNAISSNRVRDIKFARNGLMWITTNNGLDCVDPFNLRSTSFLHDKERWTRSGEGPVKMTIDREGNIWTFSEITNRLHYFNIKESHCTHFASYEEAHSNLPMSYLTSLLIDRNERLWIGNNSQGLCLFVPSKGAFHDYKADPLDPMTMSSNTVNAIYQDRSGMIWLGTNSGAERFNPDESKFIPNKLPSNPERSLPASATAVTEDSSHRLWIGSKGIFVLNRETGVYTDYYCPKENDPHSLSASSVLSLCCDKEGRMWAGTVEGLNVFDAVRKNFHVFYEESNDRSIAGNFITCIVCDKDGNLLVGTRGGLSIYDHKTERFINFKNVVGHALLNDQINVVFEDNPEVIWLGMRNYGLISYNRKTGKVENFSKVDNDTTSLASNYVASIVRDHKGILWLGTTSGLCRFNETIRNFTTLSEKDGLPNVHVAQLMVDDKDRIWMGTNRGISMLNEARTQFTNYDSSDGLQGWEFGDHFAYRTHDGYFCYCDKKGFTMFHPDSLKKNPFIPPVVLKRIMIFDQPLATESPYSQLQRLRLSYKQNFFSFEFAALNYDHPEKNRYACQLIGFDKKMVQLGTNRTISYTNVPPGNYTLKVVASNNDGIWNEAGFELVLTVTPPFWVTWWFRTLVVTLFVVAVAVFFRLRESRIKKEQLAQTAVNKQIAEIKMTALRAQMNPHFIFNSLNAIQHFVTVRDKEEALNYLSKFSKLIRKILENSRENTVSLSNELQLLELYIQLEQLRFDHKFDYHFDVDQKIDLENTQIPPLLIQPYVENAILHGLLNKDGKGDLWLSVQRNNGMLVCGIEDNGIGRTKAREIEQAKISKHRSLGIKVTDERIATLSTLLDYKIDVTIEDLCEQKQTSADEDQPLGTRVTITIPVKEDE